MEARPSGRSSSRLCMTEKTMRAVRFWTSSGILLILLRLISSISSEGNLKIYEKLASHLGWNNTLYRNGPLLEFHKSCLPEHSGIEGEHNLQSDKGYGRDNYWRERVLSMISIYTWWTSIVLNLRGPSDNSPSCVTNWERTYLSTLSLMISTTCSGMESMGA